MNKAIRILLEITGLVLVMTAFVLWALMEVGPL